MDDFCITGQEKQEVDEALKSLKRILRSIGFTINEEKSSQTAQTEIDWLGFKLTCGRLEIKEATRE